MKDNIKMVSNKKLLYGAILFTLLMILYAQFILGHFSKCFALDSTINSLGLSFGYSNTDVLHFFELRSTEQLMCYSSFLKIWDALFPILYTAMYLFWIRYLFNNWLYLSIIPFTHMILDWVENYFEIRLVNEYLELGLISEHLVSSGSTVTIAKWILSFATYIILFYGIIYKLKAYITSPKPH